MILLIIDRPQDFILFHLWYLESLCQAVEDYFAALWAFVCTWCRHVLSLIKLEELLKARLMEEVLAIMQKGAILLCSDSLRAFAAKAWLGGLEKTIWCPELLLKSQRTESIEAKASLLVLKTNQKIILLQGNILML